jgi:hypothetical protein
LKRLKTFLKQFDVSKSYPEEWWMDMLHCYRRGDNLYAHKDCDFLELSLIRHQLSDLLTAFASYSLPTVEALNKIKHFVGNQCIHEHMAGSGYWAYHLRKIGVQIDAFTKDDGQYPICDANRFIDVAEQDIIDAELPIGAVLMLSWVPHGSNAPLYILKKMQRSQRLIYIGDKSCCGDDEMHDFLHLYFKQIDSHEIPQLMELNAGMWFYERKPVACQKETRQKVLL